MWPWKYKLVHFATWPLKLLLNPVHLFLIITEGSYFVYILCIQWTFFQVVLCPHLSNLAKLLTLVCALAPCCKNEHSIISSFGLLHHIHHMIQRQLRNQEIIIENLYFTLPVYTWKYLKCQQYVNLFSVQMCHWGTGYEEQTFIQG